MPPVPLQQWASPEVASGPEPGGTSERGGRSELGETTESGGLEHIDSAPPTVWSLLGRGIPHQRRTTGPAGNAGHGGEGERSAVGGEHMSTPETKAAPPNVYLSSKSKETSSDGDILLEGSDISSTGEFGPVPAMLRDAERAPT